MVRRQVYGCKNRAGIPLQVLPEACCQVKFQRHRGVLSPGLSCLCVGVIKEMPMS